MIGVLKKKLDKQSKVLLKNSGWVFFSNMFSTGLAFLRSIVIARGLGPEIYGTYAVVVTFVGLVQELLNLNTGTALIRFGASYHVEGRNDKLIALVKSSVRLSAWAAFISISIISFISFFSYTTIVSKPGLEWFIIFYAIAASITYLNSISRGMLRLYYKFRISSLIQMVMDVLETIVITIAVFWYPKDLNVFFVAIILTRFLNGFICNLIAYYELRSEIKPYLSASDEVISEDKKTIKGFVLGNSLGNTLQTVINQGDVLLLGWLSNAAEVGFYLVSKKLAYSIFTLTDPLVQSIYPQLSKLLAEKKFIEVRKMLYKITAIGFIPGLLFFIGAYFLDEWIIGTLYGKAYLASASSFLFFVISAVFGAAMFWALPLVQSLGMVKIRLQAYVVTIVLGTVLAFWLVPLYQSAGMALALFVTKMLNLFIFLLAAHRRLREIEKNAVASS